MKSIIGDKLLYDWSKLLDLQPDGLKVPINIDALKKSLLKNNFAFPFFGYKDEEGVWIIDGHTRKQVLYELLQAGEDVPELLEVQLINCESKDKAREILLEVFNQKHNPMNEEVLIEYIEQYQLDVDVIPLNVFVEKIEDVEHEKTEDNYTGNFPLAIILLKKDYYEIEFSGLDGFVYNIGRNHWRRDADKMKNLKTFKDLLVYFWNTPEFSKSIFQIQLFKPYLNIKEKKFEVCDKNMHLAHFDGTNYKDNMYIIYNPN